MIRNPRQPEKEKEKSTMLHRITSFNGIDSRKLMDLYREGNLENAEYFYPEEPLPTAMQKCEADFLQFLQTKFFQREGSEYWILEAEDTWVSALRLSRIEDGFYYLEALETHPDFRKKGYAARLLCDVIEELKARGPFRLCDCVSKTNLASVRVHRKCGFEIVSEAAFDYLNNETNENHYGMQYSCSP